MWLTVTAPAGLGTGQLVLAIVAVAGGVLSNWCPLVGALVAGLATAGAWSIGATADPFLLASVGVFTFAERRGLRRFPWWLLLAGALLAVTTLVLGSPPNATGFEELMRGMLLSAIVLAVAWVLGVRTGQARCESAARARTDERLRLARDVHDVLSHSLGAIGVQAGVAAHIADLGEDELRQTLHEVESQARSSMVELKALLERQRAFGSGFETVSLPLSVLLRDTASTAERLGLEVELNSVEGLEILPATTRETVHRVVRESVTNAIRHANASAIRISVTMRDATLETIISDNGIGAPEGVREGHGLTGMRERLALAGGDLRVESTPKGFTVTARMPVSCATTENAIRS